MEVQALPCARRAATRGSPPVPAPPRRSPGAQQPHRGSRSPAASGARRQPRSSPCTRFTTWSVGSRSASSTAAAACDVAPFFAPSSSRGGYVGLRAVAPVHPAACSVPVRAARARSPGRSWQPAWWSPATRPREGRSPAAAGRARRPAGPPRPTAIATAPRARRGIRASPRSGCPPPLPVTARRHQANAVCQARRRSASAPAFAGTGEQQPRTRRDQIAAGAGSRASSGCQVGL